MSNITIKLHNLVTTMLGLIEFLTIQERQRFESISTSWEFIPNTNLGRPDQWSPLVQLRSTFHGLVQCRTIRDNQLPGRSGPTCPRLTSGSPHIITTIKSVYFYRTGPGLSWATWLHGRNELSVQLSEWHAFNLDRSANNGTVLNRHRRDQHSQPNTICI